jgi:DNA-binding NarL/FixJ family response regulator
MIERERDLLICGMASSPSEALAAMASQKPHVVLFAFSLTSAAAFALIRETRARHEKIPLLVLSSTEDLVLAKRVSRSGAKGFITRTDASGCMIEAIYRLARGLTYVGAKTSLALAGQLFDMIEDQPVSRARDFTSRELEILELVGGGHAPREIAEALRLSVKTVESHRQNIKHKLGIKTAARLAQYAFQWLHSRRQEERKA